MSNLMSIKLDSINFIIWKLQLTMILDAYSMIDHINGSQTQSSQFLPDAEGNHTSEMNHSFKAWKLREKAPLTLIYSTLSVAKSGWIELCSRSLADFGAMIHLHNSSKYTESENAASRTQERE